MIKTSPNFHGDFIEYFPDNNWEKPAGQASLHYDEEKIAGIWNVVILEQFRGQGFGQKMMQEVVEYFLEKHPDIPCLFLLVAKSNEIAQHIYMKIGFEIVGDGHFPGTWRMEYKK